MSVTAAQLPDSPSTLFDASTIRQLLEDHRAAQLDQIKAMTFAHPDDSDLDPGARMRAMSAAKRTLDEIDQAVLRLLDGTYGACAGCAAPVMVERLLAVPYTRYCVPCASAV
jgi:RNA polymerase-binding transcription factor DksA